MSQQQHNVKLLAEARQKAERAGKLLESFPVRHTNEGLKLLREARDTYRKIASSELATEALSVDYALAYYGLFHGVETRQARNLARALALAAWKQGARHMLRGALLMGMLGRTSTSFVAKPKLRDKASLRTAQGT